MSMFINARKIRSLFKENQKQVTRGYMIMLERIVKNIVLTSINESENKRINTEDIPIELNKYMK